MDKRLSGIINGIIAYLMWGLLGIFWQQLHTISAFNILAYRIGWSFLTMVLILTVTRKWRALGTTVQHLYQQKKLRWIFLSAIFISINWFIYIFMVTHHQATEASLGYYIMPLFNVVVAVVFLKERLAPFKIWAILLAFVGVLLLTFQTGKLPLTTILMAASFCLYGLIKKQVPLPATFSIFLETIFVLPFALLYIIFGSSMSYFNQPLSIQVLLALGGLLTILPLLFFALATMNVDFITLSFIQYMNPTIQLLVAVLVLHEAFSWQKTIVFAFIWVGILIFTIGSVHDYRRTQKKLS